MKALSEFIPLILFFIAYKYSDIITATGVLVLATVVLLSVQWITTRAISMMPLVSAVILVFFGGLTLFSGDETFIKMKPTIVSSIFAGILGVGLLQGKGYIKFLLSQVLELPDAAWKTLSIRWMFFFLFLAGMNELVWRNFSEEIWVQYRVFGILPMTIIFAFTQWPILKQGIPADQPSQKSSGVKHKGHVYTLYDMIHQWYDNARTKTLMEKEYLHFIHQHIPNNSEILDLGCGTGEPIASFFIEHDHAITGVDAAANMLAYCQKRFPEHTWIEGDMRTFSLDKVFDAILAWDSFFHLPHDDQRAMFPIFQSHIKKGGYLLFTTGTEHGEVIGQMDGHDFYHASLSEEEYQRQLESHGFEVVLYRKMDENCGDHTVWLAQYKNDH